MEHGGARPGAGRKRGAKSTKTQEIALKAAENGATPVEVILWVMRTAFDEAQKAHKADDLERALQMGSMAMGAADKAAPYVHPKMAPKPTDDGTGAGYTVFKAGGVLNGVLHGNLPRTTDPARGPDGPLEAAK